MQPHCRRLPMPGSRLSMDWFREMRAYYHVMGPARFALFFGGLTVVILAFGTMGCRLGERAGWPEEYDFRCRGRGCYLTYLAESHRLLKHGGMYELGLFAWLWLIPFSTGAMIAVVLVRRFIRRRRNRIRPLDYD